jgi:hypothetical protein
MNPRRAAVLAMISLVIGSAIPFVVWADGERSSTAVCDDVLGCNSTVRGLASAASETSDVTVSVLGMLERREGGWLLRDLESPEIVLRVLIPDALVARALGQPLDANNSKAPKQQLIRILGARVAADPQGRLAPLIHDFAAIQVLSSRQEAEMSLSVDGRGQTRCAKIVDLLGDYCLVSVGVVANDRPLYDGQRLFLQGYLRCGLGAGATDVIYSSREFAQGGVTSEAILLEDGWRKDIPHSGALCEASAPFAVNVRIAGRFLAADSETSRRDSVGLLRDVESVWPLERIPTARTGIE